MHSVFKLLMIGVNLELLLKVNGYNTVVRTTPLRFQWAP